MSEFFSGAFCFQVGLEDLEKVLPQFLQRYRVEPDEEVPNLWILLFDSAHSVCGQLILGKGLRYAAYLRYSSIAALLLLIAYRSWQKVHLSTFSRSEPLRV